MHHGGNWYPGEHAAILERKLFDQVQALLKSNRVVKATQQSRSGALLMGKLFDDRGNVMTPSFSVKKGVRYRFYVSSALLKGRKSEVGSVGRVQAVAIEETIKEFVSKHFENHTTNDECVRDLLVRTIRRIEVRKSCLRLTLQSAEGRTVDQPPQTIDLPWIAKRPSAAATDPLPSTEPAANPQLLNAIVRAHAWVKLLDDGTYDSIEDLSRAVSLHPNFVRLAIRAAFIDPEITESVLRGTANPALLSKLRRDFAIGWSTQHQQLGFA